MDLHEPKDTVDPEVRAYVYSLVSALGGTGADEEGRYVLGDDALACLKDLKKWLKFHDEKANRLDVARCFAEANLVGGDLLPILASWPEEVADDRIRGKMALACLELLVPLTWPIEKNDQQMTVNHHRHVPYLQLAQVSYKKSILEYEPAKILRNAVRVGLPSMALPAGERSTRDDGVIKLLLYFFRNLAMIAQPPNLPAEHEVSRSATIEAFHNQDVLALLLTISSNVGEDFRTQDTVIMEILFHLLKGVDVQELFMDKAQASKKSADELQSLLITEKNMHRNYAKTAPTRHNRFGTMIWVKRDDARVSTVSGQEVLTNNQRTLLKMDQSKRWNKMKPRSKNTEPASDRFDLHVSLNDLASTYLRLFVEEFLDSSFNPLFNSIRKAIEREVDRVLDSHLPQFFYLISWFLEAERSRRRQKREDGKKKKIMEAFEADSFALVASVLNQETFIALNRFMQDRLDNKLWRDVHAGTRCFTQILLIVQEMAESPLEEDQEIAENIQNRIFYEEATHDRILAILRHYKDQGFGYLESCTELSHVFLKMLERYSKENINLQIRSRRRARVKRKAAAVQARNSAESADDASEMEDVADAERTTRERQFDFNRFSAKFVTQSCVNTFVSFMRYYQDLNQDQLKRAHRFFYRVAFKQELSVMLFRVDIIALFNQMIKGPEGLDPKGPMFKEWDELVRQLFKRLNKKLQQRPALIVEALFSKINSSVFFLEHGYEKEIAISKPRAPATLEVKGAMTKDEQIGVVIAVFHGNNHLDVVDWVAKIIDSAANERQSWEAEAAGRRILSNAGEGEAQEAETPSRPPSIVVVSDNGELRMAMFKNNKVRLLMTLVGLERVGDEDDPDAAWIVSSALSAEELHRIYETIIKHRNNPTMEYGDEDPVQAEDLLRRASAVKPRRAAYDDDSDSATDSKGDDAEEFLFPAGGPTSRKSTALEKLKRKRRRRKTAADSEDGMDEEEPIDDETSRARRRAREAAELERRRKIKSNKFIRGSDDETDEEADRRFFEREEMMRKGQSRKVLEALKAGKVSTVVEGNFNHRKRKIERSDKRNVKKKRSKVHASNEEDAQRGSETRRISENNNDNDSDDSLSSSSTSSTTSTTTPRHSRSEPSAQQTPLSSPRFEESGTTSQQPRHRLQQLLLQEEEEEEEEEGRSSNVRHGLNSRTFEMLDPAPDGHFDPDIDIAKIHPDINMRSISVDDEEEEEEDIDKSPPSPPASWSIPRPPPPPARGRARVVISDDSDEG